MTLYVTRAGPADLDELALLLDAYRQFYRKPPDLPGAIAFLRERMEKEESVAYMARMDESAVGFTQLYPLFSSTRMAPLWLLNDLYVAPAARGRGIGEALLERARKFAVESGACQMLLETANDNPARRLYERRGYRHITEHAFYALELADSGTTGVV